jgi:SH3 domain-containing YSC84-like protein 1
MPSLPSIDFYLEKEIKKATAMLYGFKNTLGEETIPRELLDIAKGVVFFTIVKVGFMFTGRYGTGLVVAKLPDGTWSAPSAVQMSGVGWGLQIGAELTDVMLILSSDSAVNAFKSRAQVSVGAELGVSVGPVGRSIESDVTAGNKGAAHAFSYAQSKGLFVGASLEASGIAARPDVNRAFYGEKVSVSSLLDGSYPSPRGARVLYEAINDVLYGGLPPTAAVSYRGRPLNGVVSADAATSTTTPASASAASAVPGMNMNMNNGKNNTHGYNHHGGGSYGASYNNINSGGNGGGGALMGSSDETRMNSNNNDIGHSTMSNNSNSNISNNSSGSSGGADNTHPVDSTQSSIHYYNNTASNNSNTSQQTVFRAVPGGGKGLADHNAGNASAGAYTSFSSSKPSAGGRSGSSTSKAAGSISAAPSAPPIDTDGSVEVKL